MNREDPLQFDSLASQLSSLQPASAAQLQALAFYEAGQRAASTRPTAGLLQLRSLAAVLTVLTVCSTASYYAGSQRRAIVNADNSQNIATVDLAQSSSPPTPASAEHLPVEHELAVHEFSASQPTSGRLSTGQMPYGQFFTPLLMSWLQLPQRDAEDYLRNVELLTRPPLSRSASNTDPIYSNPHSLDRQLPELEQLQADSPLRKWLSM